MDPFTVGLALAGGSMLGQIGAGITGMQDQKKVMEAQQRFQDIQAQHERLQQVRAARVQAAHITQQGVNQGAGGSSSVQTGAAGAFGEAFGNISYINQTQRASQQITSAREQVVQDQGMADLFGGVTEIGKTIMGAPPGVFG